MDISGGLSTLGPVGELAELLVVHESPTRLAVRRFAQNRLALGASITLTAIVLLCVFAPLVTPYDPAQTDTSALRQPPNAAHPFGTDGAGRDVLSRVLYGGRNSLLVGLAAVAIYLLIGTTLGAISGFLGGLVDGVIQRVTDTVMSFPGLVLIIALVPVLGPGLGSIVLVIGLLGWPSVCRIVPAETLSLREREFALAARGIGATRSRIVVRHLLPNAIGPLLVVASFGVADAMIIEAGLSLLGLGIQSPDTSWGLLLNASRDVGTVAARPWMWVFPGAALAITVLCINFIGDGLRDALDPREVSRVR